MNLYRCVARHILSSHEPPDLRGAVVLLPNYHAAKPLARALADESGLPALLLPQMTTLADWVESIDLKVEVRTDAQRTALLYGALRDRDWFPDANLWSLSRELLALTDELTRHRVKLPDSTEEFARQLGLAYRAKQGQTLQFEARVVHELWYAMAASSEIDERSAYQMKLGMLAGRIAKPLCVLRTCEPSIEEVRFLEGCEERVDVRIFDIRTMAEEPLLATSLLHDEYQDLMSAVSVLKASPFNSEGSRKVRLFGAQGLEQEAKAADVQIRRWLLEGRKSIAVVVQDRLVARRLRALLERARVEVEDETGWTFSTLSVSNVLMRWLEALKRDFYYQDLLDLLKSPYLFFEDPSGRKQAAYLFEQLVRRHGVIAHIEDYIGLAERESPDLIRPLVRLRQAARIFQKTVDGRQKTEKRLDFPLAKWLEALLESLEILGVSEGFRGDDAGRQLLQQLAIWQDEMSFDKTPFSFSEWRRWLAQQLDLITYRDMRVESPVMFTHLAATRWHSFDAVLLLGADAAHLPAPMNTGPWFNDAVRSSLGLPLSSEQRKKVSDDLYCLLAMNDEILITWQAGKNGEHNLLSPLVEMMRTVHKLAFKADLLDDELGELIESAQVELQEPGSRVRDAGVRVRGVGGMPNPAIAVALVPRKISPSGYNSLMACPYQYYARHALGLNEIDEVRETLDKRDYGTWVHEVLQRFHGEIPCVKEMGKENAEKEMLRISDEVFAEGISRDYLAEGWFMRWRNLIPPYIDWQLENERSGMRCQACELYIETELDENIKLHGKLDRLDAGENGAKRVLDYKTKSANQLKGMMKDLGEDVQLACYAYMSNASDAAFVSLDEKKVESIALGEDSGELTRQNIERLKKVFEDIRNGQGVPANGADRACIYCEMKGLCRKGEWETERNRGLQIEDGGANG